MKIELRCVNIAKALVRKPGAPGKPPVESLNWVVTLQSEQEGLGVQNVNFRLATPPSFDTGDTVGAELVLVPAMKTPA